MSILRALGRTVAALSSTVEQFFRAVLWPRSSDPIRDYDEAFSPIDVEAVRRHFDLVEQARRFGKRGLPDTLDTALDGPQMRIIAFVQEKVADAFRRANTEFERLRNALKARDVTPLVARAERLPDEVIETIARTTREAETRKTAAALQCEELRRQLDEYKARYRVDRPPRLRDATERRLLLYGTVLLALLQAGANATFFGQGMSYGLTAGIWFAFILGLADVLMHFAIGRQAARVCAPELWNRMLGGALVVVALITVPSYNLGLVHLRLNVRRLGFAEGTDSWWTSVTSDPLGFTDFSSFALLVIGSVCSVLAVVTGWSWDEPIPRLRELGKKLEIERMEHDFWKDREQEASYEVRAEAVAELERIRGQVAHNVMMAEALVSRSERLHQNLNTFVRDAERACKALIQIYRDENRLARRTPPPAYFRDEPAIRFEAPMVIDLREFKEFLGEQIKLRDRLAKETQGLHERITGRGDTNAPRQELLDA